MPSLLKSNKEATKLMLRMRTLINLEFNVLLNFTHDEIETQLCAYGFKSQSSELVTKAKQLAVLATIQPPDELKNINNILELLGSDDLKKTVLISAAGISAFVIDKASNKFWSVSSLTHLNKLSEIDINAIKIQPLTHGALKGLKKDQRLFQSIINQTIPMNPLPLEEFFWFASVHFSQNQLLQGLKQLKQVRLTRWPEICRKGQYQSYAQMAIQLMRHPASISEFIKTQGKTSEIEVIIFLNACYLCDWLIETQGSLQVTQADPNKKTKLNFISRIRAKLGIGKP